MLTLYSRGNILVGNKSYLTIFFFAKTPAAIEIKKTNAIGSRVARAEIAGPGQSPTSPQPTQKREAPMTIFLSSFCFLGKLI